MEALTGRDRAAADTYLRGLGASGALIVGAVVVFLLMVGLVAFDAFPRAAGLLSGAGSDRDAADVRAPAEAAATALAPSADLVDDGGAASLGPAGEPARGGDTGGGAGGGGNGGGSPRPGDGGSGSGTGTVPGGAPGDGGATGGGGTTGGGGGTGSGGGSTAGTVNDTVSGVGNTVNQTLNGLGNTVNQTLNGVGNTVNQTLNGLGNTVNQTLNGLGDNNP